jgi:putative endopeptidase
MKISYLTGCVGASVLLSACCFLQEPTSIKSKEPASVLTKAPPLMSADFSYMNMAVDPKEDFFQFVNGKWIADNPIPDSESRWGSFNEVSDRNNDVIRTLLEEASASTVHPKGSAKQMIGDYYYAIMDNKTRNSAKTVPIQKQVDKINAASKADLATLLADFHMNGLGGVFGMYVDQDLVDNSKYVVKIGQGGQGLPDKDYYFKDDEKSVETRAAYLEHLEKMFALVGSKQASKKATSIMALEKEFASASMNRLERRDIEAQNNEMTLAELKAICPSFDWDVYFANMGIPVFDTIIVGQPAYFEKFESILAKGDYNAFKDYLHWNVLNKTASMLSADLETQNFAFYATYMRGAKEMKPDWKRAVGVMNWTMGEPLGRAFVETNFSPESKARVNEMVDNLGAALKERIAQLDWMSPETKEQAYLKLGSFMRKLGYPDTWKDMSSVTITRASIIDNWMAISRFNKNENIAKLGKPIDRTEWGMPAHIVNAYYNPAMNEIVFPAGIMQPPFFDPNAEDAVNYARMGAVIGHEMIHGFDDQGAKFDHEGKFRNWWTEEDMSLFEERTTRLADQYDQYEVLEGVHVNGKLTLGENIADFGGLTMAYYAYQKSLEGKSRAKINSYTPEQRFFISFGQVWKGTATDAFLRQQVATDPHSPVEFRVNGTLSNMPEFFEAFEVQNGNAMRNTNPIVIW